MNGPRRTRPRVGALSPTSLGSDNGNYRKRARVSHGSGTESPSPLESPRVRSGANLRGSRGTGLQGGGVAGDRGAVGRRHRATLQIGWRFHPWRRTAIGHPFVTSECVAEGIEPPERGRRRALDDQLTATPDADADAHQCTQVLPEPFYTTDHPVLWRPVVDLASSAPMIRRPSPRASGLTVTGWSSSSRPSARRSRAIRGCKQLRDAGTRLTARARRNG